MIFNFWFIFVSFTVLIMIGIVGTIISLVKADVVIFGISIVIGWSGMLGTWLLRRM